MSARPGGIVETRQVPSLLPRALDVCYWADFTQLVHDRCNKIAEVRPVA